MTQEEAIEGIEKEIGRKLHLVEEIDWKTVGYEQNDAQEIIGISLYDCDIKNLNKVITHFQALPALQELYLVNNQLTDVSPLNKLQNLQLLDLSENQLTDVSPLCELQNLQELHLSANHLTDIAPLSKLQNLQRLYINHNQLTDVSPLAKLKILQELNLAVNELTDISALSKLKNLQELNLNDNQLTNVSPLTKLQNLQELDLSANQLTDVSSLIKLKNLQQLDISFNSLTDVSALSKLKNLQELNLSGTESTDISPLTKLQNLQELHLNDNQQIDISPLSKLKNLRQLYLNLTQLTDISLLTKLQNLQKLDLGFNPLTDISPLIKLQNLQELDLRDNQLTNISLLTKLQNLQKLDLGFNSLTDISPLTKLQNLQRLDLSHNQLTDILPLIKLQNLQKLDLSYNELTDISPLTKLQNLQRLDLSHNELISFPQSLLELETEIKWSKHFSSLDKGVNLYENRLSSPPVEIVQQGNTAIKAYFDSLEDGTQVLEEVKVLLVGEGMAGKTSLLKQFQHHAFDQKESQTHGINVVSLSASKVKGLEEAKALKNAKLHFWDFGGQEIMHASHQFFLTKRSLYILLIDSRTDSKKEYWLRHIQKFGGDSPLIVVMNKIDENPNYNIQQQQLNEDFSNIQNRFHRISCQTGEGYSSLMDCMAKTIPTTALFGTKISQKWIDIKEALVEQTEEGRYLNKASFVQICEGHGISESDTQGVLLQFLNDLGIVLHFKNLPLLDFYVLDPHWVTIGVYKILNSSKIKNGCLYTEDLDFILNKEQIKQQEYDPAKEKPISYEGKEPSYLISIMEEFELCYPSHHTAQQSYILPNLLPKELNPTPALTEEGLLRFVLAYDYLPSNLMSSFMYKVQEQIVAGQQWRYGVLLQSPLSDCQALIKEQTEQKRITITIKGESYEKREYLSSIRQVLALIKNKFQNLEVTEYIPLPDHPDHLIKYKELLGYERNRKDDYFAGELGKEYSVADLLDSIVSKQERQKDMSKERQHITYVNNNTFSPQQHNTQKNQQEVKQTNRQTQEVSQTLQQHTQHMLGAFNTLLEDIADEVELEIEDEKEQKRAKKDIEKIKQALSELEKAKAEGAKELPAASKSRIAGFFDALADKDSRLNKCFSAVERGAKKLGDVVNWYNKMSSRQEYFNSSLSQNRT